MKKLLAALCAVLIVLTPCVALAQSPATTGNNGSPTGTGGIRVLGSDGTTDHWLNVDANGNIGVSTATTGQNTIVPHWTSHTIGAGVADSSSAAFSTDGYSKVYALIRFRGPGADGVALDLAWRSSLGANLDTTSTWYEVLGTQPRGGLTVQFNKNGGTDGIAASGTGLYRMYRIPLMDSLATGSVNSPARNFMVPSAWSSIWVKNISGATVIIDLWFELIK